MLLNSVFKEVVKLSSFCKKEKKEMQIEMKDTILKPERRGINVFTFGAVNLYVALARNV